MGNVRIEERIHDDIRELKEVQGINHTRFVNDALREALAKFKRKEKSK